MSPAVTHSVDAEGIGWIVFADPAARANRFTAARLAALGAALDALAARPVVAIVVGSAPECSFSAGTDLPWIAELPDAAAAAAVARAGQAVLARLADCKVPVVVALHGTCAGGGFELALACHWRVASAAPETRLGLPETGLGMIPGWGGTVRLPRLIGARAALDHLLQDKLVSAADALAAGLVDEVVPVPELAARARAAARRLAGGGVPARTVPPAPDAAFFAAARAGVMKKTRGREPAPLAAIGLIERTAGLPVVAALAEEARVFGDVTAGEVCQNLIHVSRLKAAAPQRTVGAWFPPAEAAPPPPPFRTIGVVGAGVMGSGIAQWCAARGHAVVLRDVQPAFVARGLAVIRGSFDEAVARGKLAPAAAAAALARVRTTTTWEGFGDCDLVIEAIVEQVAAKQQLFAELAGVVRPDCVLASNTSALPIEALAARVTHPGRTLGLHFFNPVSRMPLVELVLSPQTSRETAARTLAFVQALGKSPVLCRSSPGFFVTRVLFFYLNAACRLWEEGVPTAALDGALRDWGWPMGPARLIDEVGVDVTDFIFGELAHYFPDRFQPTTVCRRLVAAGLLGRKNGAGTGFYTYAGGAEALNPALDAWAPPARSALDAAEIAARLNRVMIDETRRVLAEGVLQTPDDADLALLLGAGFPAFRGGLMRHARRLEGG